MASGEKRHKFAQDSFHKALIETQTAKKPTKKALTNGDMIQKAKQYTILRDDEAELIQPS